MQALNRLIVVLLKALVVLSLCGMSLLTTVDATGRYLFNRPISGTVELVELLMIGVIFASIPLTTRARGHIVVDSFSHFMSHRTVMAQDRLAGIMASGISGFLAWITLKKAQSTAEYGDMTALLHIPLAPFVYFMAVLLALDALYQLGSVLVTPSPQPEQP